MKEEESSSLIFFYNFLLEAERAGVQVISGLISENKDEALKDLLEKFLRDEGMNCQVLSTLIKNSGGEPSKKTGDFVQKINQLKTAKEKILLLIKGQEWVSRQIRKNRALMTYNSDALFIESIKIQHEQNIDTLKRILHLI